MQGFDKETNTNYKNEAKAVDGTEMSQLQRYFYSIHEVTFCFIKQLKDSKIKLRK